MKARQSSELCYVTISRSNLPSAPFKPVKHPIFTSFALIKFHKLPGYLLLLLAILSSLSVFFLGLSPFVHCSSSGLNKQLREYQQFNNGLEVIQSNNSSISRDVELSQNNEFWEQPDGLGYRPCLNFSYNKKETGSRGIINGRKQRVLMAVVSGGLNQQKTQIADAVVVARILEASLVLPILSVDAVWGDESEFSDIFDDRHFKETLKDDIHVVSTPPVSHLRKRPLSPSIEVSQIDEEWIQSHLMGPLKKNGVMIIRAFDSKLSKDLSPDLQKLRCKVVFHALKFRVWIEELGEKLAKRMAQGGPYMALHLRLEKDVWVRTGCVPGLGQKADQAIGSERASRAARLKSRFNISSPRDRYLAGLCPLNATEVARLLRGLGAPNNSRIYWAGGVPYGGEKALEPLKSQFPNLYNKWAIAEEGELDGIKHRSSVLAAVDYLVCLKSHVFMANHGGNMGRALQGHRAFLGHRKHITPNKKQLVQLLENEKIEEKEMDRMIKMVHMRSMGSPLLRRRKSGRDVIAYPVPECMCNQRETRATLK